MIAIIFNVIEYFKVGNTQLTCGSLNVESRFNGCFDSESFTPAKNLLGSAYAVHILIFNLMCTRISNKMGSCDFKLADMDGSESFICACQK